MVIHYLRFLLCASQQRTKSVYRRELPRIYELRDLLPNPLPPEAYFQNLDRSLGEIPQKLRQFRDWERELEGLDRRAWSFLKGELAPLLTTRDPRRGWQPLFDKLNQARAYNHLKRAGYVHIEFVPVSIASNQQTPDLQATSGAGRVLCEVKTINVSEIEAERRAASGVGTTTDQLDAGFFRKLSSDVAVATAQMAAYDASPSAKRIIYFVINFDDRLHEYVDRYRDQIVRYVAANRSPDVEITLDIKPAFYSAMV
jgi:hypothetical protein